MKDTLVEIKKGMVGTGLLVEQDGFIDINIKDNKKLCESVINDETGLPELPRPFIVNAIFQKYGIENANGRVYPEDVLKREVEKYQQVIKERRAYGECYTPDAEVLTKHGWANITEVKKGDIILTLDTKTGKSEYKPVTYKTEEEWDNIMCHLKGENIDDIVTPTHGYPIYVFKSGVNGKFSEQVEFVGFYTASQIASVCGKSTSDVDDVYFIPTGENPDMKKYTSQKRIYINKRNISVTTEKYSGKVYCVENDNHTFYVRQNGFEHWTKNCNHPDTTTIDLERIAMNIIELHWEDHTLFGKLEFPITEGYRKYGVISNLADMCAHWVISGLRIGVSSRALGTVSKVGDYLLVNQDLTLLCWDVVSQPSVPSSYISTSYEFLQQFKESEKEEKDGIITEDRFSKFDSWLND